MTTPTPPADHGLYDSFSDGNLPNYTPPAAPAAPAEHALDLHDAIMNLPQNKAAMQHMTPGERLAYRVGHRDARHAAAELALASQTTAPALSEPALTATVVRDFKGTKIIDASLHFFDVVPEGTKLVIAVPNQTPAPAAQGLSDAEIDKVFTKFAGVNDCNTPYLRTYMEGFRPIARAILAASRTTPTPGEA